MYSVFKGQPTQRTKDDRWAWAGTMLIERRDPGDWKNVRWSDEFHAGLGPEGQLWIIRKRGNGMRGASIIYSTKRSLLIPRL